ncbi:MAG: hypothetical protein HUK40_00245 [Desulfobacter sp.]|nr:hypothetical protein [Desulfobacter sp.]WDP85726.1 MAG: hypothetical protein HUN05_11775 [Desulfobacter sp.]
MGNFITRLDLRKQFSLLLLGIKAHGSDVEFDPDPDTKITGPCDLIVMGQTDPVQASSQWPAFKTSR